MVDMQNTPYYIAHMDDGNADDPSNAIVPNENGVTINGVQYYNQTKVDELITSAKSEIQSWATGQFEPKTA